MCKYLVISGPLTALNIGKGRRLRLVGLGICLFLPDFNLYFT